MKRINIIKEFVKDKKVLDIGCIQHNWQQYLNKDWLHNQIIKYAKEVKGIDYLKKDVIILQKKGFNIIHANAEDFNLNEKFDVIIAGELIEHLFNVGRFLDSVKKHMHNKSELILTTPNAFTLGNIFRIFKGLFKIETEDNQERTHWYDKQTLLNTLKRKNFEIISFKTIYPERYNSKIFDYIIPKNLKSKLFVRAKLKK
jgi:2-polyprenyl-3-methyl-5-hydroxy-6-metoxy-1,4-benzoquinol methylase